MQWCSMQITQRDRDRETRDTKERHNRHIGARGHVIAVGVRPVSQQHNRMLYIYYLLLEAFKTFERKEIGCFHAAALTYTATLRPEVFPHAQGRPSLACGGACCRAKPEKERDGGGGERDRETDRQTDRRRAAQYGVSRPAPPSSPASSAGCECVP